MLAGRSYWEIEAAYRKRWWISVFISTALFVVLAVVVPSSWLPPPYRIGRLGEKRLARHLTPEDERREAEIEARVARRFAAVAMRWVEFVIEDDVSPRDRPRPMPLPERDPETSRAADRTGTVTIGEIIPLDQPEVEIELDENLAARASSEWSAQSNNFGILNLVRPEYPEPSLWADVEGLVTLKATVSPTGLVSDITVIDNETDFYCQEAAISSLSEWRFKPLLLDGRSIWFSVVVPIRFRLE